MINYFSEKSHQVNHKESTVFGIKFSSRYSKVDEEIEMMKFAEKCAKNKVNHYVKSIFYDSKCCYCFIDLVDSVKFGDPIERLLFEYAKSNVSQLMWYDNVYNRD